MMNNNTILDESALDEQALVTSAGDQASQVLAPAALGQWSTEPGSSSRRGAPSNAAPRKKKTDPLQRFAGEFKKPFMGHLKELYANEKEKFPSKEDSGSIVVKKTTDDVRRLSSLARILERMLTSRVCVAIALHNKTLLLSANKDGKNLAVDLGRVYEAYQERAEDKSGLITELVDGLVSKGNGNAEEWRNRLLKCGQYIDELQNNGTLEKGWQYKLYVVPDSRLHCEMDVLTTVHEYPDRLPNKWLTLGISKLCCAKCWAMFEAVKEVKDLNIFIDMPLAHMVPFGDWGIPPIFYESAEVKKLFLGSEAVKLWNEAATFSKDETGSWYTHAVKVLEKMCAFISNYSDNQGFKFFVQDIDAVSSGEDYSSGGDN